MDFRIAGLLSNSTVLARPRGLRFDPSFLCRPKAARALLSAANLTLLIPPGRLEDEESA